MSSVPPPSVAAWTRRPASSVTRLAGRPLLLLSARDLVRAALDEEIMLVALIAPCASAMVGFARAARDNSAPLLLVRPCGAGDERGPEEAREDTVFVDAALKAADSVGFLGPMALLKEPPRPGGKTPEFDRIDREIEAGFTGIALSAGADDSATTRDASLTAARACRLELGLEVIAKGGDPDLAVDLARSLSSRGAVPSTLRVTGHENEARVLADELGRIALSSEREALCSELREQGIQQLVAAGPFLRALQRSAPAALWTTLNTWADARKATLDQAAAKHARALRELPPATQDKLEALCAFEADELYARAGAKATGLRIATRVAMFAAEQV